MKKNKKSFDSLKLCLHLYRITIQNTKLRPMKNYTLKQIETSLSNKGFCPFRSYGDGVTSWIYEHENGHSTFFANVDEELLTIDGMNPTQWYQSIKSELN